MRGSRFSTVVLFGACAALAGSLASGCGSGAAQDAHEPAATFTLQVLHASFPRLQAVARPERLALTVRNAGLRTVPDVAVTLDSLSYTDAYPNLAANKRPVWIVDRGPGAIANPPVETEQVDPAGGGQTAYVNTWALGPLAPGRTRTFIWRVTPVKPGLHSVNFRVSADLAGKSHARLRGGGIPSGHFSVHIAGVPPAKHVNPETGQVVPGAAPLEAQ